jgi:hypothetical protein
LNADRKICGSPVITAFSKASKAKYQVAPIWRLFRILLTMLANIQAQVFLIFEEVFFCECVKIFLCQPEMSFLRYLRLLRVVVIIAPLLAAPPGWMPAFLCAYCSGRAVCGVSNKQIHFF